MFFSGGGGEDAASFPGEEQVFVPQYTKAGYQVVQVAWLSDWELVNDANTNYPPNILNAACRIASFLHYAYSNIYVSSQTAGMCAQGASAGGGGLAYALTWYGAWNYLDKAVFASSPVFSDIEQGCEVPNSSSVGMCASGAFYCNGWTANQYETAEYTDHATKVEEWTGGTATTGPATCANNVPPLQTTTYNTGWYNQSIVNFPATGQQPKFNYPQTTMTSWLCEGDDQEGGFNNSGSQGMLYFQQFTSNSEAGGWLQVNGVTNCLNTEGVTYGTPPPSWVTLLENNHLQPTGANAIAFDMTSPLYANNCHKLH